MDAIVYTSNTGFSRQYADLLAKKLNLAEYSLDEAKKKLPRKSEVIYIAWIRKGKLVDYKKVSALFSVKCLVGVGMGIEADGVAEGRSRLGWHDSHGLGRYQQYMPSRPRGCHEEGCHLHGCQCRYRYVYGTLRGGVL